MSGGCVSWTKQSAKAATKVRKTCQGAHWYVVCGGQASSLARRAQRWVILFSGLLLSILSSNKQKSINLLHSQWPWTIKTMIFMAKGQWIIIPAPLHILRLSQSKLSSCWLAQTLQWGFVHGHILKWISFTCRSVWSTIFVTSKKLLRNRFLHAGEFHLPLWIDMWKSYQKSQERNESEIGVCKVELKINWNYWILICNAADHKDCDISLRFVHTCLKSVPNYS